MTKSNLYKGNLSTIVMKLLNENEKMYGYEITQKVKAVTKGKLRITEGALYPTLHRLESEGILDVEVIKVDNRLRKYYRLTDKGIRETAVRLTELDEYIQTLQEIIFWKPKFGL